MVDWYCAYFTLGNKASHSQPGGGTVRRNCHLSQSGNTSGGMDDKAMCDTYSDERYCEEELLSVPLLGRRGVSPSAFVTDTNATDICAE